MKKVFHCLVPNLLVIIWNYDTVHAAENPKDFGSVGVFVVSLPPKTVKLNSVHQLYVTIKPIFMHLYQNHICLYLLE